MKKFTQEQRTRFIMYIISKTAAVLVVIIIATYCFFCAKQTMAVNVMVKDAVTKQIEEVYMPGSVDSAIIERIFTQEYLDESGILSADPAGYGVTSVNETVHVKFKLVGAFSFRTKVKVDITINRVGSSTPNNEGVPEDLVVNGRYKVSLVKKDGQWRINDFELVEAAEE